MTIPPDLSEGWYWLTYFGIGQSEADAGTEVIRIYQNVNGAMRVLLVGCDQEEKLGNMADRILRIERVAPPSWARGE